MEGLGNLVECYNQLDRDYLSINPYPKAALKDFYLLIGFSGQSCSVRRLVQVQDMR